jgi:hypothetical protein
MKFFAASLIQAVFSSGCGKNPATSIGQTELVKFSMVDPATNDNVERTYKINLPSSYDANTQYPVIFWFHGWYNVEDLPTPFVDIGQAHDVITVYPLGMDDTASGENSWNFGTAGETNICTRKAA